MLPRQPQFIHICFPLKGGTSISVRWYKRRCSSIGQWQMQRRAPFPVPAKFGWRSERQVHIHSPVLGRFPVQGGILICSAQSVERGFGASRYPEIILASSLPTIVFGWSLRELPIFSSFSIQSIFWFSSLPLNFPPSILFQQISDKKASAE
jgi:hypothetical protein